MDDPNKAGLKTGKGFPAPWIRRVEDLLGLDGDARRYAFVIFSFNLNWFFAIDPSWTKTNLVSAIEKEGEDQKAVWAGVFWSARIPDKDLYQVLKPHFLALASGKSPTSHHHVHILSGCLLAGWGTINQRTGERYVTNSEMHQVLLRSDEAFRLQILWQLKGWSSREDGKQWREQLPVFLGEVWPRDKKVKTPKISIALLDFVFSDVVNPSEMADVVLPLISQANVEHISLYSLRTAKNSIIESLPEKVLALLLAILPDDPAAWPYEIEEVLERIGAAAPSLLPDSRLVELKSRWNSR
jgi:hypothetical protein